jgi:hypothetical protein
MKALRSIFVAALLVAPVLSLNAGAVPSSAPRDLQSTQTLAGTCYFYWAGTWYAFPC